MKVSKSGRLLEQALQLISSGKLRELDALVAENVMRLALGRMSEEDAEPSIIIDQASAHFDVIPNYSSDITAAFEVFQSVFCTYRANKSAALSWCALNGKWLVSLGSDEPLIDWADTAPLAICLAALKVTK